MVARGVISLFLLASTLSAAESLRSTNVTYGPAEQLLAGELLVPVSDRKVPAVVVVQGSGNSDRSNQWSRAFASLFVEQGLAVLLTDKRGSGASAGDWRTAGFEDLAQDALSGVALLRERPEIDAKRIGLLGLSQGGQVVPIAAARSKNVAFVISISSKAVGFAEGSFVEMANTARQAGLAPSGVEQILSLNANALRFVAQDDWEPYSQLREQLLQGPTADLAAGFPATRGAPIWDFLRKVAFYDPLPWWIQVSQPALIVYGEADERDNAPVLESVRRLRHAFASVAKHDARILVIPGAGHAIRDADHGLAAEFRQALEAWLADHSLDPQL